jgi:hypothetical protein
VSTDNGLLRWIIPLPPKKFDLSELPEEYLKRQPINNCKLSVEGRILVACTETHKFMMIDTMTCSTVFEH